MVVLSDVGIKESIQKGELKIEGFSGDLLQAASYDFRAGKKALKSVKEGRQSPIIDFEREKILQIGTGEFVEVMTFEKFELPNNICGRIGLRSYFTRKGLIPFTGLQIDPGFKGHLIVSLFNTGPRTIVLRYGESFGTVEFSKLDKPAEKPYSGNYQNQTDFQSDNIEFIIGAKGVTLYEVVEVMRDLGGDVKWMERIMVAILIVLLGILITRAL